MRIFVSEYLTSGACPGIPLDSSLMREGRLMLEALLADLESLGGVQTVTTRDSRFEVRSKRPVHQTIRTFSSDEEQKLFETLIRETDAVLIIAPETDNLLEDRVHRAAGISGAVRILNCRSEAIAYCADKLTLPQRLNSLSISVVPAAPIDFAKNEHVPFDFPVVVKPRFGAGCEETYCVESDITWTRLLASILNRSAEDESQNWIVQPFVRGVSLSSVALFRSDGSLKGVLPLGRQNIHRSGNQLSYRGGTIPWVHTDSPEAAEQNETFFAQLESVLHGLRGYVGADWIWDETSQRLHLVEINPRLTTSYLGYRELYGTQIAATLIDDERDQPLEQYTGDCIRFDVEGRLARSTNSTRSAAPTFEKSGEILP
ncbi:MAG TPA: ATP-grasp domain-containing protein [Planctomycetaceae bacterium]|nr:ATP-grasp domain-containing protein [Planctomycetaceae bacterium]